MRAGRRCRSTSRYSSRRAAAPHVSWDTVPTRRSSCCRAPVPDAAILTLVNGHTLLVANRGEIAIRIFRTANRMGMRTVAVYSDADEGAPHTRAADVAVRIGPAPATESYLRRDAIVAAAQRYGA